MPLEHLFIPRSRHTYSNTAHNRHFRTCLKEMVQVTHGTLDEKTPLQAINNRKHPTRTCSGEGFMLFLELTFRV